ncbi:lipid-A-disaccharide synthase [Flavobacterium psychrophilum]|uniref:Lipid-A-disaccharide synthase n=1 Tax=Flavobacterium psychrophilum (strain ATCC 49511 / DSM 21280 / CIP 103535 / JIP02/86) TaxID=402612 RepID=A6H211_FLAPJ|nr:lipid-A-disaccharide synthase [Flavobacterium psychrophilum]AIG31055.1 lipid-A-disaccharide synthase [Flavobacterium psychrophilum]AIG33332.1 lipid-A-disaccharide synthase [Flavobacterium psychrophilum]AIG35482.1 lipid-A-disaccharide synthase [Flavobacterium psychrophilum]AIG37843.1 lipid-A-disaccharide synthase [Flavobacterium psychrophilum]AIG40114.1 lipid-A-disaccharide synthase [Flavobacterium psychrophilum]
MKYYIIAGEASGDLHGSNLMKGIYKEDSQADIRFWGGDLMQQTGGTLVKHYRDLSFMGFLEVVLNLKTILNNIKTCKADIISFKPHAIIFIDYPGFNMRIAKWSKKLGIRNHYYISPQIWAWKENRIKAIKNDVDKMYVILPFEKDFYEKKHHFSVEFVGHPLIDAINNRQKTNATQFKKDNNLDGRPIIALLPGSRKQEIEKMLSKMLSVVKDFPNHQFVIAGAPSQEYSFYKQFLTNNQVHFIANKTYDLLSISQAALVTSGTATLETALFKVPEVVLYKGSWASYQIAKRIITLKYISLVNLIMNKEVVTELIQDDCNSEKIKAELEKIIQPSYRSTLLENYDLLEKQLGGAGASDKTAGLIVRDMFKQSSKS